MDGNSLYSLYLGNRDTGDDGGGGDGGTEMGGGTSLSPQPFSSTAGEWTNQLHPFHASALLVPRVIVSTPQTTLRQTMRALEETQIRFLLASLG